MTLSLSALIQRVRELDRQRDDAHDFYNREDLAPDEESDALAVMERIDEQRLSEFGSLAPQLADAAERLQGRVAELEGQKET